MKRILLCLFVVLASLSTAKAQNNCTTPFYGDYSSANFDDLFYLWRLQTNLLPNDTAIKKAAVVFSHGLLAGYEDPTDPAGTWIEQQNYNYTIDSLFAIITHENNSQANDTIIMQATGVKPNGSPDETNILWADTVYTNTGLSVGGNWLGQGAAVVLSFTPNINVTSANDSVAIVFKYFGDITDTLALIAGSIDDGNGGTVQQSNYANSWMIYSPIQNNWTKNATVGYGNPVGSNGWFAAQNWNIWAHTCLGQVNYSGTDLCSVTYDNNSGGRLVTWQKGTNTDIASYEIQSSDGVSWITLGIQPATDFSTFLDITPNVGGVYTRYRVVELDASNNNIYQTPQHIPPVLHADYSNPNSIFLQWNMYIGTPVTKYRIYRGTNQNNLALIDSVGGGTLGYTDVNGNNTNLYQVEAVIITTCQPSAPVDPTGGDDEKSALHKNSAYSNIAFFDPNGLNESLYDKLVVYPNPAQNILNIQLPAANEQAIVKLINPLGQTVRTGNGTNKVISFDITGIANGLYIVQLEQNGRTTVKKVTVNN